jgi:predicted transcriptional regulator
MTTVILDVQTPEEAMAGFARAWHNGIPQETARISFATAELLWQTLNSKRWELLKTMCGAGPLSIRETARRVGRDVKGVHGDVTALLQTGVLERTEDGRVLFPYTAIKVEFMLTATA